MRNISLAANKRRVRNSNLEELRKVIAQGDLVCEKCSSKEHLSVDHIIPLSILVPMYQDADDDLGFSLIYEDIENFQILCRYCNTQKGGKLDVRNPRTIPLLRKLIVEVEASKLKE